MNLLTLEQLKFMEKEILSCLHNNYLTESCRRHWYQKMKQNLYKNFKFW